MIYVFAGDDVRVREKQYEAFLKTVPQDAEIFPVKAGTLNLQELESWQSGTSLFGAASIFVLRGAFEDEETAALILSALPALSASHNTFVFVEGKLGKATLDAFKKARAEISVSEAAKEKKKRPDNFRLANAFEKKDKFHLWLYFRQGIDEGAALEELAGILFWKVKDMLLRRMFAAFTEAELLRHAEKLSYLLPEARSHGSEAEAAFEQFLLEAF